MKSFGFFCLTIFLLLNTFTGCSKKNSQIQTQNQTQNLHLLAATPPTRIISLAPASTEILCSLGAIDQIVGRSQFCDFPPQTQNIPVVGGFDGKTLNAETILSFNPDFVYLTKNMHDFLIPVLSSNNISWYLSDSNSIGQIAQEIKLIGQITGHQEKGESISSSILGSFQTFKQNSPEKPVSVYWEIWNPPYMSVGQLSFIDEIITLAGGTNIFHNIEQNYPVVSDESIIFAAPQVIILPKSNATTAQIVKNRPGWQNIPAVQQDNIFIVDADLISRPGPRCIEAVQLISGLLNEKNN